MCAVCTRACSARLSHLSPLEFEVLQINGRIPLPLPRLDIVRPPGLRSASEPNPGRRLEYQNTILLPASALPGWPREVPLPIYPEWKKNYATSVRRLIRDGVDAPLGNLFVTATRTNNDDERARSASEAFLFQRLESLPETTGLFRLNPKLPIPFDGWSEMEIDLFCTGLKLATEIDGPQHLSDPAAYRSDRRKDGLLQESGCHVLRFLAEDLGKHLDATLDAILRAITYLLRKP